MNKTNLDYAKKFSCLLEENNSSKCLNTQSHIRSLIDTNADIALVSTLILINVMVTSVGIEKHPAVVKITRAGGRSTFS